MQYVGQTCRTLQKRFGEHYRRIRKPKNNDTFLYQHFKRTGHSPNDVKVQPVEKILYDENSSVRFKNIKRFETELKWIKLLQTPFPLGFNDNIYHEGNISKMPRDLHRRAAYSICESWFLIHQDVYHDLFVCS